MSKKKRKKSSANGGRQVYKSSGGQKPKTDVSWMKTKYVKQETAPGQPEQDGGEPDAEAAAEEPQQGSAAPAAEAPAAPKAADGPAPAEDTPQAQAPLPEPEHAEGSPAPEAEDSLQEEPLQEHGEADGGEPAADAGPQPQEDQPEQTDRPDQPPEAEEPEHAEQPPAGPEHAEQAGEQPPAEQAEHTPTPEELAEEQRRIAEMTRTVQVSLSQILDALPDVPPPPEEPAEEPAPEEPAPEEPEAEEPLSLGRRVGRHVGGALAGFGRWLLLVAVFLLVIGGAELVWLYKSATPDLIPEMAVTFNGEALEPTSYHWRVPVVGNLIKRTYAETLSETPFQTAETVQSALPGISVSPNSYSSQLTILDEAGQEVFSGSLGAYAAYSFEQNGLYQAVLVLSQGNSVGGGASVSGSQTYSFTFEVNMKPTVRLNTHSVRQGGVAAVRLTGVLGSAVPQISTDLCETEFVKGSTGWIAYLPVRVNRQPGEYTITVTANGYTQELTLTVSARTSSYLDYTSRDRLVTPYISLEDTPEKVEKALRTSAESILWGESGFVQPLLSNLDVKLAYGTTEYVGRTATQRENGTGSGRTSTNAVLNCTAGQDLISPADGKIVLAEKLDGTAGNTIVIDHGAGVASIFYCLGSIDVKVGQTVQQGETLGTVSKTMIGEVRIHGTPVEPLAVWRGECDAMKYY